MTDDPAIEHPPASAHGRPEARPEERRRTLTWLGKAGLVGALAAAYGTLAAFMARFLFPARPPERSWMLVGRLDEIPADEALRFRTPAGRTVNITRREAGAAGNELLALSSTCPHLGCQVHWQPQNDRFFCPCHNGIFTPEGVATGGPPAEAGQSLPRYPLDVRGQLVFIEVATDELAMGPGKILRGAPAPCGPGHDPCLSTPRRA